MRTISAIKTSQPGTKNQSKAPSMFDKVEIGPLSIISNLAVFSCPVSGLSIIARADGVVSHRKHRRVHISEVVTEWIRPWTVRQPLAANLARHWLASRGFQPLE